MKSGGSFKPGHHPVHDMRRAALMAKSPWRRGNMNTKGSERMRAQWAKERTTGERK